MYTENDILLGCFNTHNEALDAKKQYIANLLQHGDPHKEQGYMDVSLDSDVKLIHFEKEDSIENTNIVYVLQERCEAFGQVGSDIKIISTSLEQIKTMAKQLEANIDPNDFPTYYIYNELVVGTLYYESNDLYLNE